MSTPFTPRMSSATDSLSTAILQAARYLIIGGTALLPLFFIPGTPSLLGIGKVYFAVLILLLVTALLSFAFVRKGAIEGRVPLVLIGWGGVIGAAGLSALVSPAPKIALFGLSLETQTVSFLAIMALFTLTVGILFREARKETAYLLLAMFVSGFLLALIQLLQLLPGNQFTFGVLESPTSTLLGGFNDAAIFAALMIVLSLITIVALPVPRWFFGALSATIVLLLGLMAVINFTSMWVIVATVSLLLLMYALTQDRIAQMTGKIESRRMPFSIIVLTGVIFIVSATFIVGGTSLSRAVSNITGVSYVEVRPSISATWDIGRAVFSDSLFSGSGPNRFDDAWRVHKDPSLNQTIFWNTPFTAGNGYIATWIITTGLIGLLAWAAFLGLLLYSSARFWFRTDLPDPFWYFVGTVSSIGAILVFLTALVYVPGPTILLLGGILIGLFVAADRSLRREERVLFNFLTNPKTGFVLIVLTMFLVVGTVVTGYYAFRQFSAVERLASIQAFALETPEDVTRAVGELANAYNLYPSDVYLREITAYQVALMNYYVGLPNPGEAERAQFQATIENTVQAARTTTEMFPHEAANWVVLGDVYSTLVAFNVEGARDLAVEAYTRAETLDPQNPYLALQRARLAFSSGDQTQARDLANAALTRKPNYADALFFLTQLDIAAGNLDEAIANTRSLIALESNNPGRYYQLGILEAEKGNREVAIQAFNAALEINPQYANARYFLALQYVATNNIDGAIKELETVRDLSENNAAVNTVIERIRNGERNLDNLSLATPVSEPTPTEGENVKTGEAGDSDLLTPVNPGTGDAENEVGDESERESTSTTTSTPAIE